MFPSLSKGCTLRRVPSLSSPEKLRRELARTREIALEVAFIVTRLGQPFEDAHDFSLSPTQTQGLAPGRKGFIPSFPTEDVALSGMHGSMRYKVRQAERRCRRARDELELAFGDLFEVFTGSDPSDPHR